MKKIFVRTEQKTYPILVSERLENFARLVARKDYSKVGVITDKRIAGLHYQALKNELVKAGLAPILVTVPRGEREKSFTRTVWLYNKMLSKNFDRKSCLIAFGGGVIGDLCGFTASTYMRGIPFYQLPTTLLAQVDASIGGKTAVNLPKAKNLAGTFYQPELVWSDPGFLSTLPLSEMRNGLAEVIKYGVIADAAYFAYLEQHLALPLDTQVLKHIIAVASAHKARFVSQDARETKGVRELLNLGHTFAHVLETYFVYSGIKHGEAVSLGIVFACYLAEQINSFQGTERVVALLKKASLPVVLPKPVLGRRWERILMRDKKFTGGKMRFILPVRIGRSGVAEGIPMSAVRAVVRKMNDMSKY